MLRKTIIFGFIMIAISAGIPASVAYAMGRSDAIRAAEILRPRMVVRQFCAPCGDSRWTHVTIRNVKIRRRGYDYSLVINGDEIDLSHFYIKIHGNWVNIALLIGIEVSDVPEFLPSRARVP